MPHTLCLGISTGGKTFLAKRLAAAAVASGKGVIVLDPKFSEWPPGCVVFHEPRGFLAYVRRARRCFVFADEAGEQFARAAEYEWLATNARHHGHWVYFLAQGATQLKPIIRENCEELFSFKVGRRSVDVLADEFTHPNLPETLENLQKFEFVTVGKFGDLKKNILQPVGAQWVVKTLEIYACNGVKKPPEMQTLKAQTPNFDKSKPDA